MYSLLTSVLGGKINDRRLAEIIKEIGEEPEVSSDDEGTYFEFKKKGISLFLGEAGELETIFLYGENEEGFYPYEGDLPHGANFAWSRESLREKIGHPTASGQAAGILTPNVIESWDRYNTEWGAIHFRYLDDGKKLIMVTLMSWKGIP
jgi:hypothetical protein